MMGDTENLIIAAVGDAEEIQDAADQAARGEKPTAPITLEKSIRVTAR